MSETYAMAIIKDGKVMATKTVRTYFTGAMAHIEPSGQIKELEFLWGKKAAELCRDVLHHEGRWPAKP